MIRQVLMLAVLLGFCAGSAGAFAIDQPEAARQDVGADEAAVDETVADETAVDETAVAGSAADRSALDELAGQRVVGVYRSVGANGEVEFNDFGSGEPVSLVVVPAAKDAELAAITQRNEDIGLVADQLADARSGRQAELREERQQRAQRQREAALLAARTQPEARDYFPPGNFFGPAFSPFRRGPDARRRYREHRTPYRLGYGPERPRRDSRRDNRRDNEVERRPRGPGAKTAETREMSGALLRR